MKSADQRIELVTGDLTKFDVDVIFCCFSRADRAHYKSALAS